MVQVPQSKSIRPDFKWRTIPKEINNKLDIQLTLKFNTQLKDIIKKLESRHKLYCLFGKIKCT
jgi:hypothetical protein